MEPTDLQRYADTAQRSARVVIGSYSTSFSLACKMLDRATARHIANIYALVRLADEVVDGVAREAGLDARQVAAALDALEAETEQGLGSGYSTNLLVHAFSATARATGIGTELTRPFFASMRADLLRSTHDAQSLEQYIYGSAEVVGLMCLQVFRAMPGSQRSRTPEATAAARSLGAAFQKVNFLRDLAADSQQLGRSYFPGTPAQGFSEAQKSALVAEIYADLAIAERGISLLPPGAARAVRMAHDLFAELNRQLERTAASELLTRRISVSTPRKALIAARTMLGTISWSTK
ncbi:phytoene synthase [Glutamicibacter sp. BW80]|uniref:phytoene/squalene synthase family protein n=1 Tax=unclassified Glutamicibacter TaxID=2627139 RepID=UPI000BB980F9|nr:squalene/phytoene synthase family protein [Glutamicibacter sp. BW80]PCC27434.1 phytoene synthase [Glutamicibacter sp. BW80]